MTTLQIRSVATALFVSISIIFGNCCPVFAQLYERDSAYLEKHHLAYLKDSLKYTSDFTNGYAKIVYHSGNSNFVDERGEKVYQAGQVTAFTQYYSQQFPEKYFVCKDKNQKFGIIDTAGQTILANIYDEIYYDEKRRGLFFVLEKDGKMALMNHELKMVVDFKYDQMTNLLNDSLILVRDRKINKLGILNILSGKLIIPIEYDDNKVTTRQWGIILAKGKYYGMYDLSGNLLLPFNEYTSFVESGDQFIMAKNAAGSAVIDIAGNIVIPGGTYDFIHHYDYKTEVFIVKKNNLWGAVSKSNSMLIPIKYEAVKALANGHCEVILQGQKQIFELKH